MIERPNKYRTNNQKSQGKTPLNKRALSAGYNAASRSKDRPTPSELLARFPDYTPVAIEKYLQGYDKKKAALKDTGAALIKATSAGWHRALYYGERPTVEEIIKKYPNYTKEQVNAYYKGYDKKSESMKASGGAAQANINRIKKIAADAAYYINSAPSEAKIKKLHPDFTEADVQLYLDSFYEKRSEIIKKHSEKVLSELDVSNTDVIIEAESISELKEANVPKPILITFRKNDSNDLTCQLQEPTKRRAVLARIVN